MTENADGDEVVSMRLHWIVFGPPLFGCLLIFVSTRVLPILFRSLGVQAQVFGGVSIFILSVGSLVFIAFALARSIALWMSTRLLIEEDRVILESGLVFKYKNLLSIGDVIGVDCRQSVLGRIFDFGDLVIDTRGVDRVALCNVPHPSDIADLIMSRKQSLGRNFGK